MNISSHQGGHFIIISFGIAMLLTIMPLPDPILYFRPHWVLLLLIYWILVLPDRIGVLSAFIIGLLMDVLTATLLGQHALSFSIVAYLTLLIHQRVKVAPFWQQSFSILLLIFVDIIIGRWILGMSSRPIYEISYWVTPLISAIIWPWLFIILRDIHRRFHIR